MITYFFIIMDILVNLNIKILTSIVRAIKHYLPTTIINDIAFN